MRQDRSKTIKQNVIDLNKSTMYISSCDSFEIKKVQQKDNLEDWNTPQYDNHHTILKYPKNCKRNSKERIASDFQKNAIVNNYNESNIIKNEVNNTQNISMRTSQSVNNGRPFFNDSINNKSVYTNIDSENIKMNINCGEIAKEQNSNTYQIKISKKNSQNKISENETEINSLNKNFNKNNEMSATLSGHLNSSKIESNQMINKSKNDIREQNSRNQKNNILSYPYSKHNIPKFDSNIIEKYQSSSESNQFFGQNKNGNSQPNNSDSNNSSNSNNLNNTKIFDKYKVEKQLDDSKINSLKFNLQDKNKVHNSNNIKINENIQNLDSEYIQNYLKSNIANLDFSQLNFVNNKEQKSTLDRSNLPRITENKNNLNNKEPNRNINLENKLFKTYIEDKINDIICSNNKNAKMLLLLLLLIKNNNNNLFPPNFQSFENQEKHFQKEFVQKTIVNFCKYLNMNGYTIIKTKSSNKKKEMNNYRNDHLFPTDDILNNYVHKQSDDEDDDSIDSSYNDERELSCNEKNCNGKMYNDLSYNKKAKKAWLCPHSDNVHYARGKCRNCYLQSYHKQHKNSTRNMTFNDNNLIAPCHTEKLTDNNVTTEFKLKNKRIPRKRKREIDHIK